MNADPRVMEFFAAPLSPAESDRTIDQLQAHIAQHRFGFFAAELRATGEFIGFAGMSRSPADDFQHPRLPEGHPLRPHLLYRVGLLQSQP